MDNYSPGSCGMWPETQKFTFTILLPLIHNSELVGVLQGFCDSAPTDLETFADRISDLRKILASSLYLIRQLEEREQLAWTDSLTGLCNSKYLFHFLNAELARCARHGRSVAVVFVDIDWFKRVNDTHGHLLGSHVLKEVGELLRSEVRVSDVAVRYGGDEYVLALTDLGLPEAFETAERLRKKIQERVFGTAREVRIRLTISAGVSLFPVHGRTADELVHQADKAMYVAKQNNKNCTRIAV